MDTVIPTSSKSAVESQPPTRKRVGLALGGGAARGFAHVGVLKVLEEEGIPVDCIAGTSAGSLFGVLHCAGYTWREIVELAREVSWSDLIRPAWRHLGLVRSDRLEAVIERAVPVPIFEKLNIPLKVVAVDLDMGELVVIGSGPIGPAIRASCAIPGIFAPVEIDGRLLVDGGVLNSVPVDVTRSMDPDIVIAVDLNADRRRKKRPENVVDVIYFSFSLMVSHATEEQLKGADVVVSPDLHDVGYYDLKKRELAIQKGEIAMRERINIVKKSIIS